MVVLFFEGNVCFEKFSSKLWNPEMLHNKSWFIDWLLVDGWGLVVYYSRNPWLHEILWREFQGTIGCTPNRAPMERICVLPILGDLLNTCYIGLIQGFPIGGHVGRAQLSLENYVSWTWICYDLLWLNRLSHQSKRRHNGCYILVFVNFWIPFFFFRDYCCAFLEENANWLWLMIVAFGNPPLCELGWLP